MPGTLPKKLPTRERLLKAAAEAFAQHGLEGATTREIARIAGVNEVTLFRQFQSKERLLAAVLDQTLLEKPKPLSCASLEPFDEASLPSAAPETTRDPREMMRFHAVAQYDMLMQHLPLLRVFLSDVHRHSEQDREVKRAIFTRHKQALEADLRRGQEAGIVRRDLHVGLLCNQLLGVIFAEVLRRDAKYPEIGYSWEEFLESTVELFVRAIELPSAPSKKGGN